jgi:hypothetical protein
VAPALGEAVPADRVTGRCDGLTDVRVTRTLPASGSTTRSSWADGRAMFNSTPTDASSTIIEVGA